MFPPIDIEQPLFLNFCIRFFHPAALQRLLSLVHVRVGSACVGKAVVDRGVHVAGGKSVQLLLRHLARLVVAHDGELVHVELLAGLELVRQHPRRGFPDVLVHGRRHGADHPAVAVAVAHAAAHFLGLGALPQLIPRLVVKVAHNELLLGAVAGHDVAVGVDEERVERHIAREQALLPIDVVDEAHVEVRAEPLLGLVGLEELFTRSSKFWATMGRSLMMFFASTK